MEVVRKIEIVSMSTVPAAGRASGNNADTLAIIPRRSLPRISGARDDNPLAVEECEGCQAERSRSLQAMAFASLRHWQPGVNSVWQSHPFGTKRSIVNNQ